LKGTVSEKDRLAKHFAKRLERFQTAQAYDESHLLKSKAVTSLSEQVKGLADELADREESRSKVTELQFKLNSLSKDKQMLEQSFKSGSESLELEVTRLRKDLKVA